MTAEVEHQPSVDWPYPPEPARIEYEGFRLLPSLSLRRPSRTASTFRSSDTITHKFVSSRGARVFSTGSAELIRSSLLEEDAAKIRSSTTQKLLKSDILQAPPFPDVLCFESWWTENGQRVFANIDYYVATQECIVRMDFQLTVKLTHKDGTPFDIYDLHVGAELNVLGRRITLKKANLATQLWLDWTAKQLLKEKKLIELELFKFRGVAADRGGQYNLPQRCEPVDVLIQHVPLGGRVHVAAIRADLVKLLQELKEHRPFWGGEQLIEDQHLFVSRGTTTTNGLSPGSTMQPDTSKRGSMLSTANLPTSTPVSLRQPSTMAALNIAPNTSGDLASGSMQERNFNYLEWLDSIPLASSAARNKAAYSQPGKSQAPSRVPTVNNLKPTGPAGRGAVSSLPSGPINISLEAAKAAAADISEPPDG